MPKGVWAIFKDKLCLFWIALLT